ncbi:MAG: geopeptide radical SAM maturase [Nitrospirae bacterium]|nr:geopeptide radical SAM maturase [Nitrospirota bacterium]
MKLSRYIKIYPYPEKQGYCLLFSTKRASTILLHESVLKSIDNGNIQPQAVTTLSSLGFLMPDLNKEKKEMADLFEEADKKRRVFNAVVVMNLDCNLACSYCFEGEMKGRLYMTQTTSDDIVGFAEGYFERGRNTNFVFYGGEPLLSIELIKYISGRLKRLSEQRGLMYSFSLVTNGTLLTKKIVGELKGFGLKGARITIDGLKENHNMHRPFKSGAGTFDTIIRNIRDVCEAVKIQIGGNFSKDNYREFPLLLDYLLKEKITPDRISNVKFDPISNITSNYALPDFRDGCESINEPWLYEANQYLREEILKRGFHTPKITPSPCMMEFQDNIVVNYDGAIYKCPALIGRKGFEVGSLRAGIMDYRESHNLNSWKTERCLDCEYLPLCFGGCRFMKLERDGDIDGVDCKRPYFDATLESLIKQDIKYTLKFNDV